MAEILGSTRINFITGKDEADTIRAECRWRKQTLLFSATLEGKGIEGFTEDLLKNPAEKAAKQHLAK